jgi:hypothetical protein
MSAIGAKRTSLFALSPLFGVKRTCRFALQMSANDPKRTVNRRRGMSAYPLKRLEKQRCKSAERHADQEYSPF